MLPLLFNTWIQSKTFVLYWKSERHQNCIRKYLANVQYLKWGLSWGYTKSSQVTAAVVESIRSNVSHSSDFKCLNHKLQYSCPWMAWHFKGAGYTDGISSAQRHWNCYFVIWQSIWNAGVQGKNDKSMCIQIWEPFNVPQNILPFEWGESPQSGINNSNKFTRLKCMYSMYAR